MSPAEKPPTGAAAVRAVREVVSRIPPGTVLSYGDVAELALLTTARVPARIMALGQAGSEAPWWRVVRADGTLPDRLQITAREHYEREATPLRHTTAHWVQVDMARARWDGQPVGDGDVSGAARDPDQASAGPATSKNEPRGSKTRPVRRS